MDYAAPLRASLHRWGSLRSATVERALGAIDWETALPRGPGRSGFLYSPARLGDGAFDFSPRLSVLLAELLDLAPGVRVALPSPRPRLLGRLVDAAGARPFDPIKDASAERSLEVAPAPAAVALSEDGFSLRVNLQPYEESLTKHIHTGAGDADIVLDNMPLRAGDHPPRPIRHVLVLEGFARRALEGRPRTPQDERFLDAVHTTWRPAARRSDATPAVRERLDAARRWFQVAYVHQFAGDVADAAELYRASIDAFPTSEAHTFLGWALSMSGDFQAAILECERAIEADPSLGNPYNDIGAYWLELGEPRRALPWFDRALRADRYEAPHFAHCNLGRALLALGEPEGARRAFGAALSLAPEYRPAQEYLRRLAPR